MLKTAQCAKLALFALVMLMAACATKPDTAFTKPIKSAAISSNYGPRGGSFHHGIDFAAPRGTDVYAARDGKVIFRGRRKRFGRLVIIDHGGGVQTYYAHLSGYNTRKGKKVKRGQRIGRVGKSGRASGYHLHFEVRVLGRSVNPRSVVPL
ncbi:MAG: M23 family metallopeptidase [Pseudomonadota bacterium]